MASVTPIKRATGYGWIVQARNEKKQMRRESFFGTDPAKVEKAARDFGRLVDRVGITEASRQRDARTNAAPDTLTLGQWVDRYLDVDTGIWRGATPGTRETNRRAIETYIRPRFGEMPIDAINGDDVAQWMVWMEKQPSTRGGTLAPKTVKNWHALLSQILQSAADRGLRAGNPARGMKPERGERAREMTVLTQDEFAHLMLHTRAEWRPFFRLLAGSGMRFGEATALTWADLHKAPGGYLITITKAWQRPPTGSARRILGPPKSDAGNRTIGIPAQLVADIANPVDAKPADLIFPNLNGEALWSGTIWTRVWSPALDAANDPAACKALSIVLTAAAREKRPDAPEIAIPVLGKRPRIHDLRHSHASWMIAAGRPLPYIQARLGHEKITTTVDVYGHLLPDAQMGDIAAVSAFMGIEAEPELVQIES